MAGKARRPELDLSTQAAIQRRADIETHDDIRQILLAIITFIQTGRSKVTSSYAVVGHGQGVVLTAADPQLFVAMWRLLKGDEDIKLISVPDRIIIVLPSCAVKGYW